MNTIRQINRAVSQAQTSNVKKTGGGDFMQIMKDLTKDVNDKLETANQKVQAFATGQNQDLQDVVVASEKADISLRFLLQLRNKLLDAYQEMMRMQV